MSCSVACIIYRNNRILIARRLPKGEMGGRWEFPGGKIDEGEGAQDAVEREMREEFGVDATIGEKIGACTFVHGGKTCSVEAYAVSLAHDGLTIPFTLTEHTAYEWVLPNEILNRTFVDSDLQLYPAVKKYLETKNV